MYPGTTQRRNKDGSSVRYYALAENVRDPQKGHVEAKVVRGFGRADRLDRAALERLVRSIRRGLDADGSAAAAAATGRERAIEIEASFELGVVPRGRAVLGPARHRPGNCRTAGNRRGGAPRMRPPCWRWRRSAWRGPAPSSPVTSLARSDLAARGQGSRPGPAPSRTPNLRAKEVVIDAGERRRRYIPCLDTEEAERERRHRHESLELLRLELDRLAGDHPKAACRLVAPKRFGPYLSLDADSRPFIDRAKVRRAEQLDGKFVLTTNDDTLSAADIALGYEGMSIIEACLRRMKTTGLGSRPMFHWTPRRIVAHAKLCALALMIQRAAEIAAEAPWSRLVDVLKRLEAVRYTAEGETIVQTSRIGPELAAILKKLDISTPKPILAVG